MTFLQRRIERLKNSDKNSKEFINYPTKSVLSIIKYLEVREEITLIQKDATSLYVIKYSHHLQIC